jgi:AraC family transcriptional regulator
VKIEIAERTDVKVAFLRYTGPPGEPIGRFWRATVAPWLADNGLVDCPRYGVSLDDPATTPPEKCRYDACVELPKGLSLEDAEETTIPGGRYAITNFRGTGAEIGAAWCAFVGEALANPSNIFDHQRHPFEHYPRGALFDSRSGVFACELCLPLAP